MKSAWRRTKIPRSTIHKIEVIYRRGWFSKRRKHRGDMNST